MPADVSKATAARLAERMITDSAEVLTMAIGDGAADLALFEIVDFSVAVANARDDVRRGAAFLVPGNDEDGVAVALEALTLEDVTARASLSRNPGPARISPEEETACGKQP